MLAPQVSQIRNAALIEREAVTLPLDYAFGFELADVGQAAIEVQRQCRRADGRGLSGSRSRDRLDDGRAINGDRFRHCVCSCSVALGYLTSAFGGIAGRAGLAAGSTLSRTTLKA